MYLEKLGLVYICKRYVLKFVMHFKHLRRCKCMVQLSFWWLYLHSKSNCIPFNRESYPTEYLLGYRACKGKVIQLRNSNLMQHLSLNHTVCYISCSAIVWNISCWEQAGGLSMGLCSSWSGVLYGILCNFTALNVIEWCQGDKWPQEDWMNNELTK